MAITARDRPHLLILIGGGERLVANKSLMASVKSRFRSLVKPALFRLFGEKGYEYFQYLGKRRDIDGKLIDEPEMELFPKFVGPSDEVLDIGANYAYHTHRLAKLCPHGQVYAFEPIPFTYRVCRRLVTHYGFKNVQLFEKGVGASTRQEPFRVPVVEFGGISGGQSHMAGRNNELEGRSQHYAFDGDQEIVCSVVDIDSFLTDLRRLAFVKMDIEGAEYFALMGMRHTLARFRPIIMLEINPFFLTGFGIEQGDLRNLLTQAGYGLYRYRPSEAKLRLYSDDSFEEANYICLSEEHVARLGELI